MKTQVILTLLLTSTTAGSAFGACTPGDFVSSPESRATVNIEGRQYSPACLKVKAGTVVTIQASGVHPLQGVANTDGPANPFHRGSNSTSPDTQQLNDAGRYNFFCAHHGDAQGNGMAGTILVE